jgi:hypothetical protein
MSVYTSCPSWVDIYEDPDSVRRPGWYIGECRMCDAQTSGYEPIVEEWADGHAECGLRTALETLPIRPGTARKLGLRPPEPRPTAILTVRGNLDDVVRADLKAALAALATDSPRSLVLP